MGALDGDQKAPPLLSAVIHEERIVLAQQSVDEETNETLASNPCIQIETARMPYERGDFRACFQQDSLGSETRIAKDFAVTLP